MTLSRKCSRTACGRAAVATLTYVYADSVAVLGPLATYAEPHSYDLCESHAERLTAPRGWEVVRLAADSLPQTHDDLVALANVVREARQEQRPAEEPRARRVPPVKPGGVRATSRGGIPRATHLRVVAPPTD
ncbi:MAG: DUF3499 domain-containing protein [Tetrasphaera sp.]|nr:DUF3499 domain-containing protein [Tetrasphaera sp.]